MSGPFCVDLAAIRAAAAALSGIVLETACPVSPTLSAMLDAPVRLKLENRQHTASFKARGALIRLLDLDAEERRRGVIAMSAGNHAQGVAWHAARLGIPATIVMPKGTPFAKVRATERHGARVLIEGDQLVDAAAFADDLAARERLTFIHPYDDPRIIAGQGTVGLEIAAAAPEVDTVVVPIGGGGLCAGVAVAIRALRPNARIIGVQAAAYPSMHHGIRGIDLPAPSPTIAEGIAVKTPGVLTRPIIEALVDEIILVDEAQIEEAVLLLIDEEKLVVEGAGAAPLAAMLARPDLARGRNLSLVVSGGNIDANLLASVLIRGQARRGRLVRVRIQVPDQPGTLARVATEIARLGANVLEVHHERWFYDVPIKLTEVDFVLEMRDPAHVRELLQGLKRAGFSAQVLSGLARPDESGALH